MSFPTGGECGWKPNPSQAMQTKVLEEEWPPAGEQSSGGPRRGLRPRTELRIEAKDRAKDGSDVRTE